MSTSNEYTKYALAACLGGAVMWEYMRRRVPGRHAIGTTVKPSLEAIAKAWTPPSKPTNRLRLPDTAAVHPRTISMAPEELPSRYRFFISAVVPRPIALVSSVSADGTPNLSPFSYFGLVNHDPGTIVVSFVEKGRQGGDTLQNILSDEGDGAASVKGGFCVHLMSEGFLAAANHTCGNFAPDVDEFQEAGLTALPSVHIKAPRCAEAMVAMECRRVGVYPMNGVDGKRSATMVIGEVIHMHIHEAAWDAEKGVIRHDVVKPMTRLGGNTYGCLGETFDLPRPRVPADTTTKS